MTGSGPGNWYSIASIMMSHCQNKAHSGSKLVSNNFIILSHLQHSYQKATVLVKYSKESSLWSINGKTMATDPSRIELLD